MKSPGAIAFSIFGTDIMWYGILISLAFLLAIYLSYKRSHIYNIKPDYILDFALWMIPLAILGARLYYVVFSWEHYKGDLMSIFNIRGGGLAIHGGLIAGILVAIVFCEAKHIKLLDLGDLVLPTVALAQAIGRWGNFFNSEAHGGPTDLPWAIIVEGEKVHPTFLYESIWCLLIFVFLIRIERKRQFSGEIALLYGMLYSIERFFVEGLRTDSLMIGNFRQAQVLSVFAFIFCFVGFIALKIYSNKYSSKHNSKKDIKYSSKKRRKK